LYRFSVARRDDLVETIIPFFRRHTLRTAKQTSITHDQNPQRLHAKHSTLGVDKDIVRSAWRHAG
jgi:hypothetical protein